MEFTAQLDVDVVALEAEDEVTCLVSLTAPVPDEVADRPGETLIAVVDRSGLTQVLLRDRFAGPHTVPVATDKAWTAASFRTASGALGEETQPGKPMSALRAPPTNCTRSRTSSASVVNATVRRCGGASWARP